MDEIINIILPIAVIGVSAYLLYTSGKCILEGEKDILSCIKEKNSDLVKTQIDNYVNTQKNRLEISKSGGISLGQNLGCKLTGLKSDGILSAIKGDIKKCDGTERSSITTILTDIINPNQSVLIRKKRKK
jgi:hypothetical protein